MRVLVLGATGGTGRQVVAQALGHGHEVTVLVRDASRFGDAGRVRVVEGDVTDPTAVQQALDGVDAVVSALGSRGERPVRVYSDGVATVIRAMTARGVRRLVVVTAAGAGSDRRGLPLTVRLFSASPGIREVYEDMGRMEGDVMLSDLDWTIVRPAALTDGEQVGHYRVVPGNFVPKGARVSRADLAALLLKCAETSRYVREAVAVAY